MTPFYHVFKLPDKFPSEYCFGSGVPVTIQMVDWFGAEEELPEKELISFVLRKRYAFNGRLLVIERNTRKALIIETQDNMP